MIKTKDGYAKLIGTTYSGSVSRVLLSNGGDHILGNSNGNIPLNNGTVNTNLNADMLDGLHIHAGRNKEANKIVRTDASGYILAGWINTTSGDIGTGAINKIYCSNDDYIRYKTPANFFPTLANSGNNISITVAGLNRTLTVGYATNADKLDGYHAESFIKKHTEYNFNSNGTTPYNYVWLCRIGNKNGYSGLALTLDVNSRYHKHYQINMLISTGQYAYSSSSISINKSDSAPNVYYVRTANDSSIGYDYFDIYVTCSAWNNGGYKIINTNVNGNLSFTNKCTLVDSVPSGAVAVGLMYSSVNYANSAGNADTVDGLHLYTRNLGINGSSWTFASTANANATTHIYAATSAGTSGQILKSTGGTPTWINQSDISAGYADSSGNASSATKLTSSAGSATLPIYFSGGKPVACTASSVFSNLSNSGNNISVTVAGQNRTLTVGYATNANYATCAPAAANWGVTGSTTKIKVKINSATSWMLSFVVTLYQGYKATKIMISGYNYGSNYWYLPEAVLLGDSDGATSISVYFGYDSAYNLWVGFNGGSYTGVSISDVTNGYTQISSLKGLFTISNVSSLTTLQKTITATNLVYHADYSRYVYCTSGKYLNFQWSGQSGLPTWLFGSNDGTNVYVWNPSNFSVKYASSAGSVAWGNVTGKPSSFTPASHNHFFTLGTTTITTGETRTAITGPFAVYTNASAKEAFSIYRDSAAEGVKHWVDDGMYHIEYTNDEAASSIAIRLINTDSERATNKGADAKDVTVYLDCYRNFYPSGNNTGSIGTSSSKWANMYATTFHGLLDGNATTATNADKVDGLHFNWNNNKNDHTYLWAASSNGLAYLVHRASMSVNYASSAGSASTVTVNSSDANSTYRMVWHSGNTLYGTNNIYCNPSSDQIYSAGFRHVSYNSASYLLRSDGGTAAFNWSGQSGQPTWLWGGNSQHTYYVYNPSNFNVNSAAVLRGNASNPNNSHPGHGAKVFYSWNTGQAGNDTSGYSNGITIGSNPGNTAYGFQIVQNMWDDRTYTRRYNGGWQSWKTLAWTSDIPTVTNYYWANVKVSASSSTSTSPTFSTCYTSNWFRSTGLTGWYSESYGGGIYMTDSTWVRIYNDKKFYVNNSEYNAIHSAGGVYVAGMVHSYSNYLKSTKNGKYVTIGPQNSSHAHYETDATVSHWFNKRVDVNGAIWRYNTNYGIDSDGYFYAKGIYANRDGSSTGGGVSLYTNTDPMVYGIAFRGTGTYGTHGYVTSADDWATYLTMNDSTTRGWIFRRGNTNVASIAGSGNMSIGLHLEFSNGAHISTNRSTDYHYGYTFNLSSNTQSIGMYSGPAGEAGGVVISPDGCLIYNSSDCGYNLQVRDKDLGTDLTATATLTFGIELSGYYAWSRGGFKKNGSSDSYVLLGGGGHKAISDFSMSHSHPYLQLAGGTMAGVIASNVSSGSYINANKGNAIINSKAAAGFNMLARMKSTNGVFIHGVYNNAYKFYYTSDTTISAGTNTVTSYLMSLGEDGYVMSSHLVPLSNATYTLGLSGNRWTHGYFNSTLYIGATNSTATNAVANCSELGAGCIELSHSTPYIDFHYNKGTGDYTSRIIATDASCLAITSNLYIGGLSNTGYRLRVAGLTCIDGVFSISNSSGSSIVTTIDRNGKIITNGSIYAEHFYENSDIRYKKILKNLSINSNTIANLPLFDFEWIENNVIGTGTSALAVLQILPNLVSGTDKLTLDYGVLGTIAGITACKELVTLKSELLQLKEKVKLLEDKLRKYENI